MQASPIRRRKEEKRRSGTNLLLLLLFITHRPTGCSGSLSGWCVGQSECMWRRGRKRGPVRWWRARETLRRNVQQVRRNTGVEYKQHLQPKATSRPKQTWGCFDWAAYRRMRRWRRARTPFRRSTCPTCSCRTCRDRHSFGFRSRRRCRQWPGACLVCALRDEDSQGSHQRVYCWNQFKHATWTRNRNLNKISNNIDFFKKNPAL